MRRSLPILLTILTVLLIAPAATAQQVQSYLQADSLRVGDPFNFSLVLKKDRDYDEVIFPDSSNLGDDFLISNRKRYSVNDFTDSLAYQIQYFGTADTTFPALPVRLRAGTDTTTLYTQPSPIYFKTTLEGEEDALDPLKPIFHFAYNWWPWIAGLLALLLLAAAGWWAYRRWKKQPEKEPRSEPVPQPFVDPLRELREGLEEIDQILSEQDQLDYKLFYSRLGDALRLYFERVYQIKALEMTSRELLRELNRLAVDDTLIRPTASILREADMVKFARFTPDDQQALDALREARHFANEAGDTDYVRIERLKRQHEAREQARIEQFYAGEEDEQEEAEPESGGEEAESTRKEEEA